MSHEIENIMYVGATPWHKLGVALDSPPTAAEAIKLAGLDWEVGLKSLVTSDDASPVDHKATYRKSDGRILGVVGPRYRPIQNSQAFDFFDPFLASGEASLETAGSLRNGERVWVLAKLNKEPSTIVKGDDVMKYVLLANSHDGTLAGRVGFTPIRVVCHNTLSMAIGAGNPSKLLRVRHTENAQAALDAIREIMNLANRAFEATAAQYRFLASKQVVKEDLEKFINLVFRPAKTEKEKAHEDAINGLGAIDASGDSTLANLLDKPIGDNSANALAETAERASRVREPIEQLFANGAGNNLPGAAGTYWAAYNAVTEYVTHHRGRDGEARLNSMFADGANLNAKALSAALTMAKAA